MVADKSTNAPLLKDGNRGATMCTVTRVDFVKSPPETQAYKANGVECRAEHNGRYEWCAFVDMSDPGNYKCSALNYPCITCGEVVVFLTDEQVKRILQGEEKERT